MPGRGIEGDRHFIQASSSPNKPGSGSDITFIESEAIQEIKQDYGIEIQAGDTRRNILTEGVRLNELVGRGFAVGQVKLNGVALCEPCDHLEILVKHGIKDALQRRGGLRADILTEGTIRVGDIVHASTR